MLKLATYAVLTLSTAAVSWTGFRATAKPADAPQTVASDDPLTSSAAFRHRKGLPNHWRGYVLSQQRF